MSQGMAWCSYLCQISRQAMQDYLAAGQMLTDAAAGWEGPGCQVRKLYWGDKHKLMLRGKTFFIPMVY